MKVAVVGAGIAGCLTALELVSCGEQVHVYDNSADGGNCSYAAAGMLSPLAELALANPRIYELGTRSLTLWPQVIAELVRPVFFQQTGSIIAAHGRDAAELDLFIAQVRNKLRVDQLSLKELSSERCSELEPELACTKSYYVANEGQIDAQGLMAVLKETLLQRGVVWHQRMVGDIAPYQVDGVMHDGVFDCRGLGAKADIAGLRGIRGELIWLHAPEVTLMRPVRVFHPRYSIYVVPRPDKHFLIGATEIESEDYSPISVRSTLELLSAAYSVHAGFAEARVVKTVTQCRPVMADHMPYVDVQPGLTRINGLYRHGFLLAPALVEEAFLL